MSGSPAVTPAGAQNPTPQQQQQQQLRQILEKLDQVLADIKASSEREENTKSRDAEDN